MFKRIVRLTASLMLVAGIMTASAGTVTADPAVPSITSTNVATATYGSPFSFTVTATGDPLPTVSKTGKLPTGITFTGNPDGTATLAGTPTAGAAGVYPLTLKAKNTVGTATQSFTLTVNRIPKVNAVPLASRIVTGDISPYTLIITTTGFPAAALSESGDLPDGLSFTDNNDGTATISGDASQATLGKYPLTITATNNEGTATKSFNLLRYNPAVIDRNTSPSFIIANEGFETNRNYTATGFPTPTLSITGTLPTGLVFYPATGLLEGTLATGTSGDYHVTITATNKAGTDHIDVTIHVIDTPPQ